MSSRMLLVPLLVGACSSEPYVFSDDLDTLVFDLQEADAVITVIAESRPRVDTSSHRLDGGRVDIHEEAGRGTVTSRCEDNCGLWVEAVLPRDPLTIEATIDEGSAQFHLPPDNDLSLVVEEGRVTLGQAGYPRSLDLVLGSGDATVNLLEGTYDFEVEDSGGAVELPAGLVHGDGPPVQIFLGDGELNLTSSPGPSLPVEE